MSGVFMVDLSPCGFCCCSGPHAVDPRDVRLPRSQLEAEAGGRGGPFGPNDLAHGLRCLALRRPGVHGGAPGLEEVPGAGADLQGVHEGTSAAARGGAAEAAAVGPGQELMRGGRSLMLKRPNVNI